MARETAWEGLRASQVEWRGVESRGVESSSGLDSELNLFRYSDIQIFISMK